MRKLPLLLSLILPLSLVSLFSHSENLLGAENEKFRLIVKFRHEVVLDVHDGKLFTAPEKSLTEQEKAITGKYAFRQVMQYSEEEKTQMRKGLNLSPRGRNSFNIYDFRGMAYLMGSEEKTYIELEAIAGEFNQLPIVEYTVIEPVIPPPPPSTTPEFSHLQDYRQANVGNNVIGLDIDYAWSIGITGEGVGIADIEWGFDYDHEDLQGENYIELLPTTNHDYDDHGTAVAGVMIARDNGFGMTGMVHGADVFYGISEITYGRVYGIALGIENLNEGDVFLYEMQTGGQGGNYVPADFNMAVWDVTLAASNAGIIVVAAAGNGNQNLDNPFYNEYNARGDNGSIIVGAGTRVGRNRASFSTYGSRINLQGWGDWSVATTGYGSLYNGGPHATYTHEFSGTSSATPIVASAVVAVQSFAKNELGITLTPHQMRDLLRETGTQQGTGWGLFNLVPQPNVRNAIVKLHAMYTGVENPSDFSATTIGWDQIDLQWMRNPDEQEVMVVWSPDNVFGSPEEGTSYNPSDTISGGGIVLYCGLDTVFNHTGLDPISPYYYRAYSYNEFLRYSWGYDAAATTMCQPFDVLPFTEDFDETELRPVCWEVIDHIGNGQVWQFGTHGFGLTGTTGNYAYVSSIVYGSAGSQNTELVSPVFDLTEYTTVILSFTHHFRQRQTNSTASLYYSIDMGNTWVPIREWNATTTNPAYFSLDIPEITGQAMARFKWNYTGSYGFFWDIDDIEITGSKVPLEPSEITGFIEPCAGSIQSYSVEAVTNVTYSWELPFDWELLSGQGSHSIEVQVGTSEGIISVTPANQYGSGMPAITDVYPINIPVAAEIFGPENPCVGSEASYWVEDIPEATYTWIFPEDWEIITGQSVNEVFVLVGSDSGTISLIPANICGPGNSVGLSVSPENIPQLITLEGNETVCEGSEQTYMTELLNGASYHWTFPQDWEIISGSENNIVIVVPGTESGVIVVYAQGNCDPSEPVSIQVNVNPKPPKPLIVITENILHTDASEGIQWYNQEGMISNATTGTFKPEINGEYYVIVTLNGCSSDPSNIIEILNAGIETISAGQSLRVYPNPVQDILTIEANPSSQMVGFSLINAQGIKVMTGAFTNKSELDLRSLPAGMYLLRIDTENRIIAFKVVKE